MTIIESIFEDVRSEVRSRRFNPATLGLLVQQWRLNVKTRQHLSALTKAELEDVGLTEEQVRKELAKPFWVGPSI